MQPNNPNNPNQRQIRIEFPPNLNATYANAVIIGQTGSEIIFDFVQVIPTDMRARVQDRIVMTPASAKSFLQALQQNLEMYEAKHGEIKLPPKPQSLADQLFNFTQRGDDNSNE
ncbi:MAG: DUF3467 domain-containing protein [Phototrophicales bacterium]|nr:MAG: DUF3467 domain-containing protein [Phototrophicales bacterium]